MNWWFDFSYGFQPFCFPTNFGLLWLSFHKQAFICFGPTFFHSYFQFLFLNFYIFLSITLFVSCFRLIIITAFWIHSEAFLVIVPFLFKTIRKLIFNFLFSVTIFKFDFGIPNYFNMFKLIVKLKLFVFLVSFWFEVKFESNCLDFILFKFMCSSICEGPQFE